MALLDPYATAAEYRARVQSTSATEDVDIIDQLTAAARELERHLGLPPGAFNQSALNTPLLRR